MKFYVLLIAIGSAFTLKAQTYTFSKSNGTYSNLTIPTVIKNGNWTTIEKGLMLPFPFKYWGVNIVDSIYLDEWGSVSISDNYDDEISFLFVEMNSRGIDKSPISYKVEGVTPGRIFKIEYKNVGFREDITGFPDSANVQCWLYETSNIIEFRYGSNKVKAATWSGTGPFVDIINQSSTKMISIEGNPASPTVNSGSVSTIARLNGMPVDGTIYKFTPAFGSGITNRVMQLSVSKNNIILPASIEVNSLTVYAVNGQMVRSFSGTGEMNISDLAHGVYIVILDTKNGMVRQKLFL